MVGRSGELKIVVDDFLFVRRQFGGQAGFLLQRPLVRESISDLAKWKRKCSGVEDEENYFVRPMWLCNIIV